MRELTVNETVFLVVTITLIAAAIFTFFMYPLYLQHYYYTHPPCQLLIPGATP